MSAMRRAIAAATKALVLGCALTAASSAACPAAPASPRDEAWIVSRIVGGKFDELRAVEALSRKGEPFAMFWWGRFLDYCVFGRCDHQRARALQMRAALAGHGRAKSVLIAQAESHQELDDLVAKIGIPAGGRAQIVYHVAAFEQARQATAPKDAGALISKTTADLATLVASNPQLGLVAMLAQLAQLDGKPRPAELRAASNSGHVVLAETVIRRDLLDRVSPAQTLERARAGNLAPGSAFCDTWLERAGDQKLPPNVLEVCELAAKAGFPGAVRALLRHHRFRGNKQATEHFIRLCEEMLGQRCASDIAEAYMERRSEGAKLAAKAEFWDLAAKDALNGGGETEGADQRELRRKTDRWRRDLFALMVRTELVDEACLTQRVDLTFSTVEANPQCPWRKPIEIPAEFLSAAR
jgi:hypothetical protein